MSDDLIIEVLIHEEPDSQQTVQFGPDPCQETPLFTRDEETNCPDDSETQRLGKPSRRLFIQNEESSAQLPNPN
jgi:hypothetical protein